MYLQTITSKKQFVLFPHPWNHCQLPTTQVQQEIV
jgi:hypothetical protein